MTKTKMNDLYANRRMQFSKWMKEEKIGAVMFQDTEGRRSPSVRYFTGHPMDAVFVITAEGKSILSPWDENLATKRAHVDTVVPYTKFGRKSEDALLGMLKQLKVPKGVKVEIPSTISYPLFLHFVDKAQDYNIICREDGAAQVVEKMRAIKDSYEIECIKKSAEIGDSIIDMIEEALKKGTIKTELDVAMLIEKQLRIQGCESTGFETLAAGPKRSFGIHCFPPFTNGDWGTTGLSILDFGVIYEGYTSDTTLTVAHSPLTEEQETQLSLVEKAYEESLALYKPGLLIKSAAQKADEIFAEKNRTMPHSLGHSYGLECHEFPVVRSIDDKNTPFLPGMVVTCEPGLYDPKIGGCRLENDVLITEEGHEVLTHSRIIRF